jgi:hypothetical protein
MQLVRVTDQFAHGDSSYGRSTAQFYQDGDQRQPIEAGVVRLNDHSLPFLVQKQLYETDTLAVPAHDSDLWQISGKGSVPDFSLQLPAAAPLRVTSLHEGDTLHYASTVTLTWDPPAKGDSVILNVDDTLVEHVYVATRADNGSMTFDTRRFSAFRKGPAYLYLFRRTTAEAHVGDKSFVATSEADARVLIYLMP